MRQPKRGCRSRVRARDGFTLVELLVVLLIVMILAGLLGTGALMVVRRMRKDLAKADIRFLTITLSAFYKDHKCYPPDKFDLIDKPPERFFFPSDIGPPGTYFHEGIILDSDEDRASNELLVYFLGRELPSKLNSYGPYMEFKEKQLKNTEKVAKDQYLEFLDPWGNPYVYIENYSDNTGKPPELRRGHGPFEIFSYGPDGEPDHDYWDQLNNPIEKLDRDDDDIVSWSE